MNIKMTDHGIVVKVQNKGNYVTIETDVGCELDIAHPTIISICENDIIGWTNDTVSVRRIGRNDGSGFRGRIVPLIGKPRYCDE